MRDIKFRGLRKEYNKDWYESKWMYGNLLNNETIGEVGSNLDHYKYADVIPETVGQFTGLKDKNETDIYEGDILQHNNNNIFFVKMSNNQHVLLLRDVNEESKSWRSLAWCANVKKYVKIIDNIYTTKLKRWEEKNIKNHKL